MNFEVDQKVWVRIDRKFQKGVILEVKENFIKSYEIKITDTDNMKVYHVEVPAGLIKTRINLGEK